MLNIKIYGKYLLFPAKYFGYIFMVVLKANVQVYVLMMVFNSAV